MSEVDFYKHFLADWTAVLKRQDACVAVAKDFVKFYKRRADVEQKYAKDLVKNVLFILKFLTFYLFFFVIIFVF